MPETIREKILQAVEIRLKTITEENGFNLDLHDNVYRAIRPQAAADRPLAVIWDAEQAPAPDYGNSSYIMNVAVEIVDQYTDGKGPSVAANQGMGDVILAMIGGDRTFGGIAKGIIEQNTVPEFPQKGHDTVGLTASFQIKYVTVLGDPYSQPE